MKTDTQTFTGEAAFERGVAAMEQACWAVRQVVTYMAPNLESDWGPKELRRFVVVFEEVPIP